MAGQSTRRTRRHKITVGFDIILPGGWNPPVKLDSLGLSGLLARGVARGDGNWAAQLAGVEIKVWYGSGYDETTNAILVPDEDVVWHETGILITGDLVTADLDKDLLALHNGAAFDARAEDADVWVSVYTNGLAPSGEELVLSFEAVDTL